MRACDEVIWQILAWCLALPAERHNVSTLKVRVYVKKLPTHIKGAVLSVIWKEENKEKKEKKRKKKLL
jgi:hypothetical protein